MEDTLFYFEREKYMTDEVYDKTIRNHILKITRLFKDDAPAIIAKAPQLLEVCWSPHLWLFVAANRRATDRPPHRPLDLLPRDPEHPEAFGGNFLAPSNRYLPRTRRPVSAVVRRPADALCW